MKDQKQTLKLSANGKLFAGLCLALMISWAFILWHHNHQRQKMETLMAQLASTKEEKQNLLKNYDSSLLTLDVLTGQVTADEKSLIDKNQKVNTLQSEIDRLLRSDVVSAQNNQQAERLIQHLNAQIANIYIQIKELRAANQLLTEQKNMLVVEKDQFKKLKDELETEVGKLASKAATASTLTTDSLHVTLLKTGSGGNERTVKNYKKADKFRLSFNVYNRIIEAGETNIFITIVDPEGNTIKLSEESQVTDNAADYTVMLPVDVQPGVERAIQFQWAKSKDFKKGNYVVSVYHNGYKIGEVSLPLGKSKQASV